MRDLLAPLHDHKGRKTPSEASRVWFILVMILSLIVGLSASGGNIVIGSACGLVMATALLNIGWLFLNTIGEGRETVALTKAVIRMSDMNESE
ncbi:MAG TPA: hypothetical protein D7H76_04865 [Candidatus Poseidoniales archaeon]|nr:MAG TPA: hypothetical protein D7H76_04865 [Candidatus Poseidoniales archaeon]HII53073.1 hypothetical protein [Candidatus Thalassarchaeaceae archaeon]|tara:strand:- start:2856 stop:3134 length:279 start_codon:yes stop_codon:yes gene_type:complete